MKRFLPPLKAAFLYLLAILLLAGCGYGPSQEYLDLYKQGYYITQDDMRETTWKCREIDFYFSEMGPCCVGEYKVDGISYYAAGGPASQHNGFYFTFCRFVDAIIDPACLDELGEAYYSREKADIVGYLTASHRYDSENDIIYVELAEGKTLFGYEGTTLTFDRVGEIAKRPEARWYCVEVDMYLDSFCDTPGYYRGMYFSEGEAIELRGCESDARNLYEFSADYRWFPDLVLERNGDELIGHFSSDIVRYPIGAEYPYNAKLTFVKESLLPEVEDSAQSALQN